MQNLLFILAFAASCSSGSLIPSRPHNPRQAKGIAVNIGQNYVDEWQAFATAIRKPAGISVYGDIYSGALDSDSQTLLAEYAQSDSGNVEVGFSEKDAMTSNGYTMYQGAQLQNDIASGKYDSQINAFAASLAQYPHITYLIRIDYEVSGNFFANTNPSTFDSSTFDLNAYPSAYRHVRSLILAQLSNVRFVYHAVRGQAPLLYPGDDVVDLIGFSVFNNDVCLADGPNNNCQPGQTVDTNLLSDVEWAPKPKFVAESSVQPPSSADDRGFIEYLTRVQSLLTGNPGFVGWTYINSDWTAHGWDASAWGDSRIETRPAVQQWFEQNVVNNPTFTFG